MKKKSHRPSGGDGSLDTGKEGKKVRKIRSLVKCAGQKKIAKV